MIEEIKQMSKMSGNLNSTFLALSLKSDHPTNFCEFRPISLCNMLYKIISKIISLRFKPILSNSITFEKSRILKDRHVHEAVGASQESIHSIKTSDQATFVLKINLSKTFDKISWTFIQLLLLHVGFSYQATKWIMSHVTTPQFVILINGAITKVFFPLLGG